MRPAQRPLVQDAEAYQRLLDIAAQADAEEGIRQGLDDVAHERTRPAREVFDEIRRKHDIPQLNWLIAQFAISKSSMWRRTLLSLKPPLGGTTG